jgi:hypothetical protein
MNKKMEFCALTCSLQNAANRIQLKIKDSWKTKKN